MYGVCGSNGNIGHGVIKRVIIEELADKIMCESENGTSCLFSGLFGLSSKRMKGFFLKNHPFGRCFLKYPPLKFILEEV